MFYIKYECHYNERHLYTAGKLALLMSRLRDRFRAMFRLVKQNNSKQKVKNFETEQILQIFTEFNKKPTKYLVMVLIAVTLLKYSVSVSKAPKSLQSAKQCQFCLRAI